MIPHWIRKLLEDSGAKLTYTIEFEKKAYYPDKPYYPDKFNPFLGYEYEEVDSNYLYTEINKFCNENDIDIRELTINNAYSTSFVKINCTHEAKRLFQSFLFETHYADVKIVR